MKHNPLYDELRRAFPPVPIVGAHAFGGPTGYCGGAEEYRRQLDGKTWEQLDPIYFCRRTDGIHFLDAQYVAAVLPLYLHLLLVFKPDSPVAEMLPSLLEKPEREDNFPDMFEYRTRRFEQLTAMLTRQQSEVVAATLRRYIMTAPLYYSDIAQSALDRYWHQFCPRTAYWGTRDRCECVMKQNVLYDELRSAFPPVPIDAEGAFAERGSRYWSPDKLCQQMHGKTWEQLDPRFFAHNEYGLQFVGTPHVVALLPLYLNMLCVFEPDPPVAEALLGELTMPPPGDWRRPSFDALVAALKLRQSAVVAATLRQYIAATSGRDERATQALEQYWDRF